MLISVFFFLKFTFRDGIYVYVLICVLLSTAQFDSQAGLPDILKNVNPARYSCNVSTAMKAANKRTGSTEIDSTRPKKKKTAFF